MVKTLTASAKIRLPVGPAIWRAQRGFGWVRRWLQAALGAPVMLLAAQRAPSTWSFMPQVQVRAGSPPVSLNLVGHRRAGDRGDTAWLLREGGLWAPGAGGRAVIG